MPKITVLMPVYNCQDFIRSAIESVLCQTLDDFELLIIDDGSTDDSVDEIKTFRDPRIRLIELREHRGIRFVRNLGLQLAQGTYLAHCDADDVSLPTRLEKQSLFLDTHPHIGVVGTHQYHVSDEGEVGVIPLPTEPWEVQWQLLFHSVIPGSTAMVRTALAKQVGGYGATHHRVAEDYQLWSKIARMACVANLADPLVRYRCHPDSTTCRHREEMEREVMRISHQNITQLLNDTMDIETTRFIRERGNTPLPFTGKLKTHGYLIKILCRFLGQYPARSWSNRFKLLGHWLVLLASIQASLWCHPMMGIQKTTMLKIGLYRLVTGKRPIW